MHKNCDYCGLDVEYELSANVVVFCPYCMKQIHMECEYGYGPVVPCYINLGTKQLGIVYEEDCRYVLEFQPESKRYVLKSRYLDAINESVKIIEERLFCRKTEN